jgi:hypothetical protein
MRLYTVYAPPEHAPGTIHRTKADAEAAEAEHERTTAGACRGVTAAPRAGALMGVTPAQQGEIHGGR